MKHVSTMTHAYEGELDVGVKRDADGRPSLALTTDWHHAVYFLTEAQLLKVALATRDVICENCDGTGEREITIGGDDSEYGPAAALADVPVVCNDCDGSGVAS